VLNQQSSKSDPELLAMIQHGGPQRIEAINIIYAKQELKRKIMNHVNKMGGDQHQAQDVFHEGIIALDRNIRADKFNRETSIEGYLFSICRNVWNNMWRQKSKVTGNEILDHQIVSAESSDVELISGEQKKYLNQLLDLIDEPCRKILTLWKASYSMQEIADECELSSQQMAKKYRYRCMKKLMEKLSQNKHLVQALRHV
jgi:RNA polymerase sigma factor (sigma-70 family)